MLKENAFIHISNRMHSAILFDTFNSKIYKIPYELAQKIQSNSLTNSEEKLINQRLSALDYSKSKIKVPKVLDSLRLIITNKCNFKCSYCFAHAGSYNMPLHEMSTDLIKEILDYFFTSYEKVTQLSFFGGEPLLALDKIEFACSYIAEHFPLKIPSYSIVTNAFLLNGAAKTVLEKNKISVIASIDGPKEINDLCRIFKDGTGTFDTVDKNIREFSNTSNIAIESTYSSIHAKNGITKNKLFDYLSKRYKTSKIIIADVVTDQNIPSKKNLENDLFMNLKFFEEFFDGNIENYNDEIVFLIRAFVTGQNYKFFCGAGYNKFAVDMDGNVYPCHLFLDSPKNILFNIEAPQVKKSFKLYSKDNAKCSQCTYRAFCSICTHEIERTPKMCLYQQKKINFFLHSMLELFISDHKRYRRILQNALHYGTKSSKER